MSRIRAIAGIAALIATAAGLNLLVLTDDPFGPAVYAPLALAVALGLVWLALTTLELARGLRRGRSLHGIGAAAATLAFLGICIVLYAFSAQWRVSWDLTAEGRRSLSDQTIQILSMLDKDVATYCFFTTSDDPQLAITREKTRRFLEHCQRFSRHVTFEFIDPQVDQSKLDSFDIQRVPKQGAIAVQCGSRKRLIPLSERTARLEERDFINALVNVVRTTDPKIYFLTGHGERNALDTATPEATGLFRALLARESYATDTLNIPETDARIPSDASAIVINNPTSDLLPHEIQALDAYVASGGRLLTLLDAWWKVAGDSASGEQLRPWLRQRFGIVFGDDIVCSKEAGATVELYPDFGALNFDQEDLTQRGSYDDAHPITRGFDKRMALKAARSATLSSPMPPKTAGTVLLRSLPQCWAETNLLRLQQEKAAEKDPGELAGPVSVAVAVAMKTDAPLGDTGNTRDARVVAIGNSFLSTNEQIKFVGHLNFLLNTVAWLTENEELIAIRPIGKEDPPLLLSRGEQRAVAWISILGVLQAIVAAGLLAHFLRRKRQ
ncbi:MAG TPA: GldG family protein [Candidatus Hydrogenedentes bacterium]|nr:GldG family protein [Candidatus Hydrogenedentota bacterium]HOS01653.1 GldG family protein [Candidatus Hydrogenedentota bacterium]